MRRPVLDLLNDRLRLHMGQRLRLHLGQGLGDTLMASLTSQNQVKKAPVFPTAGAASCNLKVREIFFNLSMCKSQVLQIRIHKDPKLLHPRIQIQIRDKLIIRIRIRNYHWRSGLLKDKYSDKKTIFNIKKFEFSTKITFKCAFRLKRKFQKNFTDKDPDPKRPEGRIRIQI